ncbi:MAG: carbohydrate ABC transporter permease [Lachnospiraceae bacterium]|nr:carbohydrate ABC transporter permease [Lachnospiraceae bacterium]MDY5742779.1 carbohydrate ABC transporter permease [Lachnospiraceae bacterium]
MLKKKKGQDLDLMDSVTDFNRVKKRTNVLLNIIFILLTLACILPIVLVLSVSLTDEKVLREFGYHLIPKKLSLSAYAFLASEWKLIGRAFGVSAIVTVIGTILGVAITTSLGYVLSRPNYKLKGLITYIVFIPMIFNGGMVASYVVNVNVLHLKDSIWAMILPLMVSSFNVIICRSFFRQSVPDSVIESAKIDGASQLRIYTGIVLPLSKPVVATIALFLSFGYWNDWFMASLYISNSKLIPIQTLLMNMQKNIEYIAKNPAAGVSLQQYIANMPTEGVRMAVAILVILPIACAYPFFQKYFISGLTIGAVKG